MQQAAVRVYRQPVGRQGRQRLADALGHHRGRLDVVRLDVDDAEPQGERRLEFLEELEVFAAAAGELERDLADPGLEDRREQIAVAALPRGLAVAVAVANVQAQPRVDAVDEGVDRAQDPRQDPGYTGGGGRVVFV